MSNTTVLTETQITFLKLLGEQEFISKNFYLSGGTALAGFYVPYRYSEDLDFFCVNEFDVMPITTFWKSKQKEFGIQEVEYQQSFNRNLYFLKLRDEVLKIEFTFYPFERIEIGRSEFGLEIDSLLDIAVNKLFTIYQQSRARDYIDLFMICKEKNYTIADLISKAKVKFDWHIDPIQLGAQFLKSKEARDYPRLIANIDKAEWQDFFEIEAIKLKSQILEP